MKKIENHWAIELISSENSQQNELTISSSNFVWLSQKNAWSCVSLPEALVLLMGTDRVHGQKKANVHRGSENIGQ